MDILFDEIYRVGHAILNRIISSSLYKIRDVHAQTYMSRVGSRSSNVL